MTSKELLYIEDALGHEKYFQSKCKETAEKISDDDLRSFVSELARKHGEMFGSFYSLLA